MAEQDRDSLTQGARFIARISVIMLVSPPWLGPLITFPTTPMRSKRR